MDGQDAARVRRRRVFYIPGYDPVPPRRYRELYRKEGAEQARISGYSLAIAPRQGGNFGWTVEAEIDGATTRTEIDVLVWSDIVRDSMEGGVLRSYLVLIRTAWIYLSTGVLFRLMRLRRGPVLAALYPVGMLLGQLLVALGAGALLYALLLQLAGGTAARLAWLVPAVAVTLLLLHGFRKLDGRFFAYYLMHDYGFSARWCGADPPPLVPRMAAFRAEISAALKEDWDEVLVIGHSSGAHLGIQILAEIVRREEVRPEGPELSFLTLGQVVPMVSFLPEAKTLRRDLAQLSAARDLFWLDVTAPGDPCCFALCDPAKVTGVAPDDQVWPLVISAAFRQTLSPEKQAQLRRRFFRLHFQYLCAFDRPGEYDYFRITAGGQSLRARYGTHEPSPGRIDIPASGYTSVAQ
ncbi:hypothetical protein [Celeribacter indicus]|uniref:Uncharacterized protein n=1 Tax=Celeribacter indicus TaxID=1208324 RepID=A0A0B5DZ56_9RHOB|nr:hypothetical protein [Celeribacter indicus]AJE46460.1 hypothetical protein P73_1745 [Celeribacter indicus]SDW57291.1 hypothetical protein SAMN05443573_104302 [Celeribacter indicus]